MSIDYIYIFQISLVWTDLQIEVGWEKQGTCWGEVVEAGNAGEGDDGADGDAGGNECDAVDLEGVKKGTAVILGKPT